MAAEYSKPSERRLGTVDDAEQVGADAVGLALFDGVAGLAFGEHALAGFCIGLGKQRNDGFAAAVCRGGRRLALGGVSGRSGALGRLLACRGLSPSAWADAVAGSPPGSTKPGFTTTLAIRESTNVLDPKITSSGSRMAAAIFVYSNWSMTSDPRVWQARETMAWVDVHSLAPDLMEPRSLLQ